MKKGLKWMAGLLTLAMVVGSFAGCGSSSSKETAAGESAAATTAESTAHKHSQLHSGQSCPDWHLHTSSYLHTLPG